MLDQLQLYTVGQSPCDYAVRNPVKYIDVNGDSIIPSQQLLNNAIVLESEFKVEGNKVFEAYIEPFASGAWIYEYQLKDHLSLHSRQAWGIIGS